MAGCVAFVEDIPFPHFVTVWIEFPAVSELSFSFYCRLGLGAVVPSGKSSTTTSTLLSSSLAGDFKRLCRQTSLKGGGRSTLSQERTRAQHERKAWNQTSVTASGRDSANEDESRTTAVLATSQPHVPMHSSAGGTKKRKRRKTRKGAVTCPVSSNEEVGEMLPSRGDQKKLIKKHVAYSQPTEAEDKMSLMMDTVPSSHLPQPNTSAHTGERGDLEEPCRRSGKKRGRRWRRRLLTAQGRIYLTHFTLNQSTSSSFHPVLFHSRTDLLRPLQLRAARTEAAFFTCLQRELARKPPVA